MDKEKISSQYLKEEEFETNEYGVYLYQNSKGNHSFNLASILADYHQWLIDNKIVNK
jgi:hypothetical protein